MTTLDAWNEKMIAAESGPSSVIVGNAELWHGDCFDVMPRLMPSSVDLVLTDPPYMIGATSVGNPQSKAGTWSDMMNAARWYESWFEASFRLLKPTGFLCVFGNWRSIPCYVRAASSLGVNISSVVVWDKEWIGPAWKTAFRPTWELVVVMPRSGESSISDRSISDVMRCQWMAGNSATWGHPAEKPESLLERFVESCCPVGGVVADWFMGSGSTGAATVPSGRRFVGVEMELQHYETARRRLAQSQGLWA